MKQYKPRGWVSDGRECLDDPDGWLHDGAKHGIAPQRPLAQCYCERIAPGTTHSHGGRAACEASARDANSLAAEALVMAEQIGSIAPGLQVDIIHGCSARRICDEGRNWSIRTPRAAPFLFSQAYSLDPTKPKSCA